MIMPEAVPFWQLVLNSEAELTPAIEQQATQISDAIVFRSFTLGPSGVSAGSYAHWDQLRDDLTQTIQLGWISDTVLANTLVDQLASARLALDAHDGTLAKRRLGMLIQTISSSTAAQRRPEVAALVLFNAERLRDNTLDTPIPFEPRMTLTPATAQVSIGTAHTLTATVLNFGDPTHPPLPNVEVGLEVNEGPNQGLRTNQTTDAAGHAVFTLTSAILGTDHVAIGFSGEGGIEQKAVASVQWTGGPDLVVPLFIPPVLSS